jgi:hypothetical protein
MHCKGITYAFQVSEAEFEAVEDGMDSGGQRPKGWGEVEGGFEVEVEVNAEVR